ncbi:MAG: TraB/GumN family protein [Proteobacteria bacterium]|nr:TraB/GumN family protein [Pseudomonadota bacterium]
MKSLRRAKHGRLTFFLLVLLCPYAVIQAAEDKAFFWQVKSGTTTVYLMGSIHFADESFYPLRSEIEQAFEQSQHLAVELDISKADQSAYQTLLAQRGMFKTGTTIKDVIADDTWQALRRQLRKLNVDYDAVKTYKPGILVLTLSAVQAIQLGFDPELGIDAYFLGKANEQTRKTPEKAVDIIELETMQQQLSLFLDIPNGDLLLKESLYSLDESDQLMADMVRLWKQGDEHGMNKLLFEDAVEEYPAFAGIYDRLFYQRNQQMTEKIITMLSKKDVYFVVVGTGHLIGDRGIVGLLKEKGYDAKRR